jgi:hypothetical protein
LRLYNVLARWCQAVGDSRLRWIDPLAPVINYTELLGALAECWAGKYFQANGAVRVDRIATLLGILFTSFIRGERTVGYLLCLSEDERVPLVDGFVQWHTVG